MRAKAGARKRGGTQTALWRSGFGWASQPERSNAYAQAVIRTLQADEDQRGCLMEERQKIRSQKSEIRNKSEYQNPKGKLAGDEERFVLLARHQTLVERGL